MKPPFSLLIAIVLASTLTSCNAQPTPSAVDDLLSLTTAFEVDEVQPTQAPTLQVTSTPPRVLSICAREPASLFLYGDSSAAARSVRQAVYDGPIDLEDFEYKAVILERLPTLDNDDAFLQPMEVSPGELIIDAEGHWVALTEGVIYRPSGCLDLDCATVYEGQESVLMDELVLRFRLLPGLRWSDGMPLTARDSVYSYEVYRHLFESLSPEASRYVKSYAALDDLTVEWIGIPGYVGLFPPKFFSPLPEHRWSGIPYERLPTLDEARRSPVGWGPYTIEEWVSGDHITLRRNPYYFRAAEGLPRFDFLVYRFVADGEEAIDALLAGECDMVDQTVLFQTSLPRLEAEQRAGNLSYAIQPSMAWELAAFGIETLQKDGVDFFSSREVRQAVAMCIDRQRIVDELFLGASVVLDSYLPPVHPLHNPDIERYAFDPEEASVLLAAAGWVDYDLDPTTPRTSVRVPGVPDGTPLAFTYWIPGEAERPQAAQIVKEGLVACGIGVEILLQESESLMGPGPEAPLFGRKFDMAQFAWSASVDPPCFLFTSEEIPGPYPDYPKGWGGANLTGYRNPAFDARCHQARTALPGDPSWIEAYHQAEALFAEDLPVIPLYQRVHLVATREDFCGLSLGLTTPSELQQVERLEYGKGCQR